MHLIVGLGNPGSEYAPTRHNAGFMAIERLAGRHGLAWKRAERFQARLAQGELEGRRVLLCEPQTFMNASGLAVQSVAAYYKVSLGELLVLLDDADLPLGELRLRPGGGSGGHHGLESIEQHLGTRDYARLRIGIGRRVDGVREITNYVLGRFEAAEGLLLKSVLERACEQVECWVRAGVAKAMNDFNGLVNSPMVNES